MIRKDNEPPMAVADWGWKYHHLGIPTEVPMNGEKYHPKFKFYASGFDSNPYGIEWMRFEAGSPVHELIKKMPHLAFEVDDLDFELSRHDFEILTPPNAPSEGTRVAMILCNGAPVELIEFEKNL